ncbi:ATP-binding cassette domain-containing protein [Desulfovibrio aminophilus]|uniref:ABC transporter ATP-binding protein n=1 Tax=Desulfovibrio aminophilus TaxID=81425 RepID=UPI003391B1DD
MTTARETLLHADNVSKKFGGILALSEYSLTLRRGDLAGLIGPNGAGKTTAFNVLSGVLAPSGGTLTFDGRDITGFDACRSARAGIARTFQNIRLFQDLTVLDNILVGFHQRMGRGFFATLLHLPSFRRAEAGMERRARELADLLGLADLLHQTAGALPYGDQRRLEIARALATEPKLLLLDEPAAGMNPQETRELADTIRRIHKEFQLTVFLVEHDMHLVMDLCEHLQVINYGRLLAEGDPAEVRANPEVVAAYLGSSENKRDWGTAC